MDSLPPTTRLPLRGRSRSSVSAEDLAVGPDQVQQIPGIAQSKQTVCDRIWAQLPNTKRSQWPRASRSHRCSPCAHQSGLRAPEHGIAQVDLFHKPSGTVLRLPLPYLMQSQAVTSKSSLFPCPFLFLSK